MATQQRSDPCRSRDLLYNLKTLILRLTNPEEFVHLKHEEALDELVGFSGIRLPHREFQFEFLRSRGLQPEHKLLEIGCGPLTVGIPLVEYLDSGNYHGVDVRPAAVDHAHVELGNANLGAKNPDIVLSTSFGVDELPPRKYDYVVVFSALYHMTDDLVRAFFSSLAKRIHAETVILGNVNVEHPGSTWDVFPFVQKPVSFYEAIAAENGLTTEDLGQLKDLNYPLDDDARLNHMLMFREA